MITVQNQNKYKNHPVYEARGDYKYATTNNPNAADVISGIFNRVGELSNQGHAIVDAIEGNNSVNIGDNVTVTPYDDTKQEPKLLGMPRSFVIAGSVTLGLITVIVIITVVVIRNKNKKSVAA